MPNKVVIIHGLDYDNCAAIFSEETLVTYLSRINKADPFYSEKVEDLKQIFERERRRFLARLKTVEEKYIKMTDTAEHYVMSASARTDFFMDRLNAEINGNGRMLPILRKIAESIGAEIDLCLWVDLMTGSDPGAAARLMESTDLDDEQQPHADTPEADKIELVKAQLWYLAAQHADADQIIYHLVDDVADDRHEILAKVIAYFKEYPDEKPANVTIVASHFDMYDEIHAYYDNSDNVKHEKSNFDEPPEPILEYDTVIGNRPPKKLSDVNVDLSNINRFCQSAITIAIRERTFNNLSQQVEPAASSAALYSRKRLKHQTAINLQHISSYFEALLSQLMENKPEDVTDIGFMNEYYPILIENLVPMLLRAKRGVPEQLKASVQRFAFLYYKHRLLTIENMPQKYDVKSAVKFSQRQQARINFDSSDLILCIEWASRISQSEYIDVDERIEYAMRTIKLQIKLVQNSLEHEDLQSVVYNLVNDLLQFKKLCEANSRWNDCITHLNSRLRKLNGLSGQEKETLDAACALLNFPKDKVFHQEIMEALKKESDVNEAKIAKFFKEKYKVDLSLQDHPLLFRANIELIEKICLLDLDKSLKRDIKLSLKKYLAYAYKQAIALHFATKSPELRLSFKDMIRIINGLKNIIEDKNLSAKERFEYQSQIGMLYIEAGNLMQQQVKKHDYLFNLIMSTVKSDALEKDAKERLLINLFKDMRDKLGPAITQELHRILKYSTGIDAYFDLISLYPDLSAKQQKPIYRINIGYLKQLRAEYLWLANDKIRLIHTAYTQSEQTSSLAINRPVSHC